MNTKYNTDEKCAQAVIFARVSSREQELGASIDAQLNTIREYCEKQDLRLIKTFKITESSTKGERKRFYEMLDFVKKQTRKTAIVVYCIDRMQRGYKECVEIDRLREEDRIEVHFYKEGLILHKDSSSTDIMRWDMGVLSAKMYIGSMKDNVKRSQKYNWENGKWQGPAPTGYINTRINSKQTDVEIDPECGPIVKRLFEEYANHHHSLQSITTLAKDLHLCSWKAGRNTPIVRSGIHHILTNPFYYGVMRVKGKLMPHRHGALIDKALFDAVQDALAGKGRPLFRVGYKETPYIFRGIIKCATCGCTITPETHTKKSGKKFTYLRCSHLKGNCVQGIVNENRILDQLEREVFDNLRIPESALPSLKSNVRAYLEKESDMNATTKKSITQRLNGLKAKEDRLFDFYLDNKIPQETYDTKKAEIEAERTELQQMAEKYAEMGDDMTETIENVVDIAGNLRNLMRSSCEEQKRAILALLLTNPKLKDATLCYCLQKPFDRLLKTPDCTHWLGDKDSNLG
ncbi:resolvase [Alphaproteobacteria bacterium]|nr:resolvase [Alphaproteobacteria bacterium]